VLTKDQGQSGMIFTTVVSCATSDTPTLGFNKSICGGIGTIYLVHPRDPDYPKYPSHPTGWDVWYADDSLNLTPRDRHAWEAWTAAGVVRLHPEPRLIQRRRYG
jgi:hypothetical protein